MIPSRLTWVLCFRGSFQSANGNSQLSPPQQDKMIRNLWVSDAKPVTALFFKGGANQTAGLINPEIRNLLTQLCSIFFALEKNNWHRKYWHYKTLTTFFAINRSPCKDICLPFLFYSVFYNITRESKFVLSVQRHLAVT